MDKTTLGKVARYFRRRLDTTNETFWPLLFDSARYLVLMGGGGSGKSIFAGQKVLDRVTGERGHRILVCRKVARTLRESCFKQLCRQAAMLHPKSGFKIHKSDLRITFRNGSELLFAGLDDAEKLKSIYGVTGIWIEEASELSEADFDQLDIRLRGETAHYKQIILTFNPVSATHWLKKRFYDHHNPRARLHHSTYRDNRFLDDEYRRVLEAFRDTDEYYYTVYCLGQWGTTGRSVFNAPALRQRMELGIRPVKRGRFLVSEASHGKAKPSSVLELDEHGPVKIYKPPEEGRPYVIGGDTAGNGSDCFVAQVLDNITGEQVAILRHPFDEDVYARQVYGLGIYYNQALVGIETNFSTYPVKELERLGYSRLFVREEEDSFTHRPKDSYGVRTTSVTRPVMISGLIAALREHPELVCDEATILELLTFVRGENLRPEAERGAHDDCVMALAIAHYIRPQMRMSLARPAGAHERWTEDMWEDYWAAGAAGREHLHQIW